MYSLSFPFLFIWSAFPPVIMSSILQVFFYDYCQDWFFSTILLGGPGVQGTNEEVSPDTSRC